MKQKKIPMRRCVATQAQFPKKELLRIVRTPEGTVDIDLMGKAKGRGAYLSKTKEAIQIAKQKKVLDRHLETQVPEEIYVKLLEIIGG